MPAEFFPSQTARHCFEIVDEDAHLHTGMARKKHVNMVFLSSEFYEGAVPFLAKLLAGFFEERQNLRSKTVSSTLCYLHQMILKTIDTM